MNTIPSYDAEFLENRRYLELQVQLGHLRDQRPDGARTDTDADGASEVGAGGTIEPVGPKIEIYDAERLARRLGHGDGFVGDPAEANNDEDAGQARQVRLWTKMHADERGPWRRLVVPDEAMIARVAGLNAICPHFGEITAWIVRAANLAQATGTPLRLDPAVVVGPPGTGKTFYARKLAEAMGVPFEVIAMNLMTDRGSAFSGLTPVWRASGPGKVAKLLIEGSHACPLIVIDEIEKASPINPRETPENVLHSLLERENAARFVDEFVDLPIRADHIFWFATANSLDPLPTSIVDRMIVFTIEPKPAEMLAIQRSIFHEANLRVGQSFAEPGAELFRGTASHNPRTLSRLWDIAMGFACEAGRRHLVAADIRGAEQVLLAGREGARRPIGFIRQATKGERGGE
ncbi:AAA family ATPase [Bosea sp. TND4EK4]|uniref:AAA family ATPase n=1 Tax=Bosea sp. TND4EK4 TaxID=1907408 RepID=UPI000955E1C6|nr:AAA family ATPase [Bosea sp. TND4EK4]SIQ36253.1 ATPase family associated with various cellular activities (AAA) [Bosea sp. TND4EK4]